MTSLRFHCSSPGTLQSTDGGVHGHTSRSSFGLSRPPKPLLCHGTSLVGPPSLSGRQRRVRVDESVSEGRGGRKLFVGTSRESGYHPVKVPLVLTLCVHSPRSRALTSTYGHPPMGREGRGGSERPSRRVPSTLDTPCVDAPPGRSWETGDLPTLSLRSSRSPTGPSPPRPRDPTSPVILVRSNVCICEPNPSRPRTGLWRTTHQRHISVTPGVTFVTVVSKGLQYVLRNYMMCTYVCCT